MTNRRGLMRFFDYGFGQLNVGEPVGPVSWPHFDLFAVHVGAISLKIGPAQLEPLTPGEAILVYPHTTLSGQCVTTGRISVQHFGFAQGIRRSQLPQPLSRLWECRKGFERLRFVCPGPLERDIERAVRLALTRQSATVHDMRVAQLCLLLGELKGGTAPSAQQIAWWQPLLEWIDGHLDHPIRLDELARQMELSSSHFRTRFRAQFGISAGRYVQRRRLHAAARRLRETSSPIKSIAQQAGYVELASFYRAFRGDYKISPGAYRQRHRLLA